MDDRLMEAALALLAANERLHSLRVTGRCPGEIEEGGRCWDGDWILTELDDRCDVCLKRAANAPLRRMARSDKAKAMRTLLRQARRVRRMTPLISCNAPASEEPTQ